MWLLWEPHHQVAKIHTEHLCQSVCLCVYVIQEMNCTAGPIFANTNTNVVHMWPSFLS